MMYEGQREKVGAARLTDSIMKNVGYSVVILWLITIDNNLNVNKYIDLMDRSIAKYNDAVMVDHRPRNYYYDL